MTDTERGGTMTAEELEQIRGRHQARFGSHGAAITASQCDLDRARLVREVDHLTAELANVLSELDEASPPTECARCRQWFRLHNMTPAEGDEWECPACWERCNALEDAQRKAVEAKS